MYRVTIINDGLETVIHSEIKSRDTPTLYDGVIKTAINKIDTFNFTILPNNPGYDLIRPLRTLVEVLNTKTGKLEFEGRVLMPVETMDKQGLFSKSFVCESELGYLNDSCQRHGEYHDISVREFLEIIIENHNRDVAGDPIDKTFVVGEVTVSTSTGRLYRYLGYEPTFETIKDKLLDRLGGELRIRKENGVRYLDYIESFGEVKNTEIRLAKNLLSIEKEVDATEIITRLVPLGTRIGSEDEDAVDASQARLTIAEVNDGKDYLVDEEAEEAVGTIVVKSHVWDDVTTPTTLKRRGEGFLRENNRAKVKHVITFLDLFLIDLDPDSIDLGNWYPVKNPVMNIDEVLRVVEKNINVVSPEDGSISVGDLFKTMSEYQSEANKSTQKIVDLESTINYQAQIIRTLRNELTAVDEAVVVVEKAIEEMDIDSLNEAIEALEIAIQNLQQAIAQIPTYEPATHEQDGLMSALDKQKLDKIAVLQNINLDELKEKLDLITVIEPIDLDDLKARVEALENAETEPENPDVE